METTLTVRQLKDLGIIDKVIDYLKLNSYSINEGLLKDDDVLTFDSEFKEKKELIIPKRHEVYCTDDSKKFIIEVINDCVIYIDRFQSYGQNKMIYRIETISLEAFNKIYIDGLSNDEYDRYMFLEEVSYEKLK